VPNQSWAVQLIAGADIGNPHPVDAIRLGKNAKDRIK
jgi:hypothetical protein